MSDHNTTAILARCRQAGLRLWKNGERIGIAPARLCPPDLLETIRSAKPQLLVVLATAGEALIEQPTATRRSTTSEPPWCQKRTAGLPGPEILHRWPTGKPVSRLVQRGGTEAQWLHTAKQILAGEFYGADKGTTDSLVLGLRGIEHASCRAAIKRLTT